VHQQSSGSPGSWKDEVVSTKIYNRPLELAGFAKDWMQEVEPGKVIKDLAMKYREEFSFKKLN